MRHILIVLLLMALVIVIELVMSGSGTKQDMTSIVGCETDSIGDRNVYLGNGQIFHQKKKNDAFHLMNSPGRFEASSSLGAAGAPPGTTQ